MAKGGMRFGAGRPGWRRKCEQSLALDVRQLHQKRLLSPGTSFSWHWTTNHGERAGSIGVSVGHQQVTLNYQWTPDGGDPRPITCPLWIDRTPCNYGGQRPWFLCPQCGRRCAVVYFGGRNGRYACRNCLNLAYLSEAEDGIGRLWRKQWRLENRLGPHGTKPKGMHWKTWERISDRITQVEQEKDAMFYVVASRLFGTIGDEELQTLLRKK